MDVDNDIDSQLLQQFSAMGTTDKEVLITQFQNLLAPNQLNAAGCAFFLDMNNWNLQAAICSYYDYEQPNNKVPQMSFVKDITIGEGESVPPNTNFIKTWRIMNSGDEAWPPACCLKYVNGDQFCHRDRVMVDALQPGSVTDVSVEMRSPEKVGVYQGQWRMCTPTGMFFGEVIWVIVQVEETGLLGVTQQLQQFGNTDFSNQPHHNPAQNPFASPGKPPSEGGNPLFSSPSPSLVTHPGSLPTTPSSGGDSRTCGGLGITPSPHVRAALFQTPAEAMEHPSHAINSDAIPLPYHTNITPPHYEGQSQGQDTDSVDMT